MFLAEQVSHHPPVSAFYGECPAKNISFIGHIYTKSAFLGMSVAVINIMNLFCFVYSLNFQGSQYRGRKNLCAIRWRRLRSNISFSLWEVNPYYALGGAWWLL